MLLHVRCGGRVIESRPSLFCLFCRAEVPAWQVERWQVRPRPETQVAPRPYEGRGANPRAAKRRTSLGP